MKDDELEEALLHLLNYYQYKNIYKEKGKYIIAEGELPVCLIAHIDTVFRHTPAFEDFLYDSEKQILWSPYGSGFDDRAGISMIIEILNHTDLRPSFIFTLGEEIGGEGALAITYKFKKAPFQKCNFLIELDRAGKNDCVFYKCGNEDFIEYIESFGFESSLGTFTDISIIAPYWKIAAVNLSVGYLDEHTGAERLNFNWYKETCKKVISILENSKDSKFYKYKELNLPCECYFCRKPLRKKHHKIDNFSICNKCYQELYNDYKYLTN